MDTNKLKTRAGIGAIIIVFIAVVSVLSFYSDQSKKHTNKVIDTAITSFMSLRGQEEIISGDIRHSDDMHEFFYTKNGEPWVLVIVEYGDDFIVEHKEVK